MPKSASASAPSTPRRAAPPPLLSHIHSSPTLRQPHPSTLPPPLSDRARARTLPRSFRASTWDEVKRREDQFERDRADGRRARGRELVRDAEWGIVVGGENERGVSTVKKGVRDARLGRRVGGGEPLLQEEDESSSPSVPSVTAGRQKHRSRSLTSRPAVDSEPRRISLGFHQSLMPVLPSVPPSPALTTVLHSSPVFSTFLPSPRTRLDFDPETTPRGPGRRPPPSRYSVPSCPPSPETNFSRPMVLGVPRIDSPPNQAGIGGSPMRTPKSTRVKVLGPRKRSTLGYATHTNLSTSTSLPQVLFPPQTSPVKYTPLSLRIAASVGSKTGSGSRSARSRLQSLFTAPSTPSPNTIPTPRNPYPSLNHTLLHSCVSLSLSSPTLSSFDLPPSDSISSSCARSRTSATLVAARGRGGISLPSPGGSSEAAETPSRPSRVRAMTTLGRGSQRAGAREERRSPVLEGLEDVMRMAQEVMVETE